MFDCVHIYNHAHVYEWMHRNSQVHAVFMFVCVRICVLLAVVFPICWAALRVIYLSYPDSVRAPSVKTVNTLTHTL